MKFLIRNTTNEDRFITRFGGIRICIPAKDFIEFDSDNSMECNYWQTIKNVTGLDVVTDINRIRLYNKLKQAGKYNVTNTSNTLTINNTTVDVITPAEQIGNNNSSIQVEVINNSDVSGDSITEIPEPEVLQNVKESEPITVDLEEVSAQINEPVTISEQVNESDKSVAYTEEELSNMSREELQEICETFEIPYKKNNSVNTLITNIMNFQNSEE